MMSRSFLPPLRRLPIETPSVTPLLIPSARSVSSRWSQRATLAAFALIASAIWANPGVAAQKPPKGEALVAYETRLREENAFFSRCTWLIDTSSMPCVFFTQVPMGGQDAIHDAAKELYLPWLTSTASTAIERYVIPLGLERIPDPTFSPVFVLQDQRTFTSTIRGASRTGHPDESSALALEKLSVTVTYMRKHTGSATKAWQRVPALRAYFRDIIRQHAPDGRLPQEIWLLNGLASMHAAHESDDINDLGVGAPPTDAVSWLESIVEDEKQWDLWLLPMFRMRGIKSDRDMLGAFRTQARDVGANLPTLEECKEAYEHLCNLRAAFMIFGGNAKYSQASVQYLGTTLKNEGSDAALEAALDTSLDFFDEGFTLWTRGLATGEYIAAAAGSASLSLGDYTTPALALIPASAQEWLALALGVAQTGDYESGIALLTKAQASVEAGEETDRIMRASKRLSALKETRDAFLQDLVGDPKKKFRMKAKAGKIVAPVVAIEAGMVKLGSNRVGVKELEINKITPLELVEALGTDASKYGPGWIAAYARLIGGENRWDKGLDKKKEGAPELIADAKADLLDVMDLGQIAGALDGLARLPKPDSVETANAVIDASREMLERFANEKAVRERADALTELCAQAFGVIHDAEGLASQLGGKIEALDNGRVRMSYTFDSAEELKDWPKDEGYLAERRQKKFPVGKTEQQSKWKVKAGNLEGDGAVCFRHAVQWESPITISYDLLYGRPQPGQGMLAHIVMGLCDDGQGSWTGGLDVYDLETREDSVKKVLVDVQTSGREIKAAKAYKMKLVHDGNSLTMYRNGEKLRTIGVEDRTAGGIFLWIHSTITVAVKGIQIEGKILKTGEDPGKARWVKKQLADMGLYL
ncbi:MAG: hypothetical protein ACI841_001419 [Planctomycetota bacterium]|jgi:hypothetical protein